MAVVDYILLVLFFGYLLVSGFLVKKKQSDEAGFLLAGRQLTLFPFVATMVTTAYGWILGVGEMYYTYGLSAWLFLSLPYTVFNLVLALFFARKARREEILSLPALLEKHYGSYVSKFGSLFVLLFTSPAMYVLMAAQILTFVLGWDIRICIALALAFSSIYLYNGGFKVLARNDMVKFGLMFGGFILMFIFLVRENGQLLPAVPDPAKLEFRFTENAWEILTWFLLASIVISDPSYHQKIYAVKRPAIARQGILLSVICWTFFDFLAACIALYGLARFPGMQHPEQVYNMLAQSILPPFALGLFVIGILSTIMSTADSFLFISAQTLMIDLLGVRWKTEKAIQVGLFIISIITFFLLLGFRDKTAVDIFFNFTPYIVSVLVVPVVSTFMPSLKLNGKLVLVQMVLSFLACLLASELHAHFFFALNPVIYGLSFSVLFSLAANLVRRVYGNRSSPAGLP